MTKMQNIDVRIMELDTKAVKKTFEKLRFSITILLNISVIYHDRKEQNVIQSTNISRPNSHYQVLIEKLWIKETYSRGAEKFMELPICQNLIK